ncbi:MAG TPA: PEP-CTERM sorting domain-containing protein [Phycisphaerales bacterium]|nr:PEP-CTERM sorting domain-containing protein [Phycisphaerales bacterium]
MKNVIASLVAVAGLSVAASAASTLTMLVSTNGVDFSNNVNLIPNSGIQRVEILTTVSNTGTAAIGLGSMQFQPTVSNWRATDALVPFTSSFGGNTTVPSGAVADAPGVYGRISPWAAAANVSSSRLFGHVHNNPDGSGQTYLRIAQAQITSWFGGTGNTTAGSGVNISQRSNVQRTTSDPAFNPSLTNVRVFRFAVDVDTNAGERVLAVEAPMAGIGNRQSDNSRMLYWYADMTESAGSIREVPTINNATITVIPTPATMALLGLGGLAVSRRRRA